MRRWARFGVASLLTLFVLAANAQTRAWLDRDRIALGETPTLNIQADQAPATGPDYSPLLRDFDVSGNSSSRQFELVNGVASQHMLFAVALQPKREGLLANAVTSSRRERRRVASYLHDGPVQELAGLAFSLAPVADDAASRGAEREATVVRTVIDRLRGTVRDLRALLVDLHPPTLASAGLDAALRDLVSPLSARGTKVELRVDGDERLDPDTQALVYRVAQEAVRNVIGYADASNVSVEVGVVDSTARLLVADDGRGFGPAPGSGQVPDSQGDDDGPQDLDGTDSQDS